MEQITIPKEEYEHLKEAFVKIKKIIFKLELEEDMLKLSEPVAEELWDNKYDEIWNTV